MNKIKKESGIIFLSTIIGLLIVLMIVLVSAANYPQGPDSITYNSNTTKADVASKLVNNSGGYISSFNLSSNTQDKRWKGLVGFVSGSFSLQDSTGSVLYNWPTNSITGRVYATRNDTTLTWANIACSNTTHLNQENVLMNHTNPNDNITVTFNTTSGATHGSFYVGPIYIDNNTCPTLNTYVNNATQDTKFEEMALYDSYNTVFATIIESRIAGYSGAPYDFQMIVPENGAPSFTSSTAYYLYVEIGT